LLVAVTTTKHAIKAIDKNKEDGKIILIGSVLGLDAPGTRASPLIQQAKQPRITLGVPLQKN